MSVVDIATGRHGRGRRPRYPFAFMAVGDRFIYGGPRDPDYLSSRAAYWQRTRGYRFTRRKLPGEGWEFRRIQ